MARIFFTGGTGYIGGCILDRLLDIRDLDITVLVRSPEKAEKLQSLGLKTVLGSNQELDKLADAAAKAQVVISVTNADDEDAAKAILNGMKRRFDITGIPPTLIHTSGTGVIADNAAGMYASEHVYDDADPESIASLPTTQLHRVVDLMIENADTEGYIKSYIVIPSTVWGIVKDTRLVKLGIQNPRSVQLPALTRAGIERRQAGITGEGLNIWPNVNVHDLADLYILLLDLVLHPPSNPPPLFQHGHAGYYFANTSHHVLKTLCTRLAEILHSLPITPSLSPSPVPVRFSKEEEEKYFGGDYMFGSNARCESNRSRAIGWNPSRGGESEMLESLKEEVEFELKLRNIRY